MSKRRRHLQNKTRQKRRRRQYARSESMRSRSASRSRISQGASALAVAASIAGGTQAYGSLVRFNNPPGAEHVTWLNGARLDVTAPASDQPGFRGESSFLHWEYHPSFELTYVTGGGELQVVPTNYTYPFLRGMMAGETIPSGDRWLRSAYSFFYTSPLPEGVATYLGIRFDLGEGNHYGWIGVTRTERELDAFAWGYETEPGVPIAAGAPEPGTLAFLAFGAGAAVCRRRRRDRSDRA